jgi:RNA polymerase sigma-70 factor (ECF subfamily)
LGNRADAEDAVQDALLPAYKHLSEFRGDAQLSTWLTTIVINCARMHLRKQSRHNHVSLDSRIGEEQEYSLSDILVDHRPNPEEECDRSMLHRRLMKSAGQLSPTLRKTFHLRFVYQLSVSEIVDSADSHRDCESANSPGTGQIDQVGPSSAQAISFLWTPPLA